MTFSLEALLYSKITGKWFSSITKLSILLVEPSFRSMNNYNTGFGFFGSAEPCSAGYHRMLWNEDIVP